MGSTRRSFTEEYKRDAVGLIVDGGHSVSEISKKLEVSETTIRKWLKRFGSVTVSSGPVEEKELTDADYLELVQLRKDNAHLKMQLEFAKKVSTWFAKGQQ